MYIPRDLIDFMLVKNDIDLEKSIADYSITTMSLSTPGNCDPLLCEGLGGWM